MNLESPSLRKQFGAFYTPEPLAEWVAAEILAAAASRNIQVRSVVDPACGGGALLKAMRRLASGTLETTGIDINPAAAADSRLSLGSNSKVSVGDALNPNCQWSQHPPDAVIMNPPWGSELPQKRSSYRESGYRLATGQFDISDLFVERALKVTRPGALLGFILPDAVFQPDHQGLREMLLQHTILLIARLGEGVFEGVYRSTAVIVMQQGAAEANHQVECLQIPSSQRKLLGQGTVSFKDIRERHSHRVRQARFADNTGSVFNIAQAESDYSVFQKFSGRPSFKWSRRVHLGRGVEIGKRGITVSCRVCGTHRAAPPVPNAIPCTSCAASIGRDSPRHTIIAKSTNETEWHPLIAGEDMDRYSAKPGRFIKLGVSGIRYKPMDHFESKKLLVRKTGVGLRAAVDESGAAATQTVFYIVVASREDEWLLDYLQGVINSRPMLAWYLRWSGENQWRSHPYVTLRVLKGLPIPDPFGDAQVVELARKIAEESRQARKGLIASDHRVDDFVCQLYDLDDDDASWVSNVLTETEEQLEYFTRMRTGAMRASLERLQATEAT